MHSAPKIPRKPFPSGGKTGWDGSRVLSGSKSCRRSTAILRRVGQPGEPRQFAKHAACGVRFERPLRRNRPSPRPWWGWEGPTGRQSTRALRKRPAGSGPTPGETVGGVPFLRAFPTRCWFAASGLRPSSATPAGDRAWDRPPRPTRPARQAESTVGRPSAPWGIPRQPSPRRNAGGLLDLMDTPCKRQAGAGRAARRVVANPLCGAWLPDWARWSRAVRDVAAGQHSAARPRG